MDGMGTGWGHPKAILARGTSQDPGRDGPATSSTTRDTPCQPTLRPESCWGPRLSPLGSRVLRSRGDSSSRDNGGRAPLDHRPVGDRRHDAATATHGTGGGRQRAHAWRDGDMAGVGGHRRTDHQRDRYRRRHDVGLDAGRRYRGPDGQRDRRRGPRLASDLLGQGARCPPAPPPVDPPPIDPRLSRAAGEYSSGRLVLQLRPGGSYQMTAIPLDLTTGHSFPTRP